MDTSHLTKLYTHSQIQSKITSLANLINKTPKTCETIIIGVLNGAYLFTSDLSKQIKIKTLIDFIGTSSYEKNKKTNEIKFTKKLKYNIKGKNVIILEDIIDTGNSLNFILEYILEQKPGNVQIWALLGRKTEFERVNAVSHFFWEFDQRDYVVGYGLDDCEYFRQLQDIYFVNEKREEWEKNGGKDED